MHKKKKEQDNTMDAVFTGAALRAVGRPPGSTRRTGPDPVTSGLQRMFAAIEDEPIPDDFLRLLDEIDARAARAVAMVPAAEVPARDTDAVDAADARIAPDATGTRQ